MFGRVLITGGAGLIGSTIADQLVDAGAEEIVVLDNLSRGRLANLEAAQRGPLTLVEGDVSDAALVDDVMDGIDLVFHQAAIRITQCAEEPRLAFDVLAGGTFNVVEAAARRGVGKVVAASSASVYGMAEDFPTAEDHHPFDNRTLYGAAKLFDEGILRAFNDTHGLPYVALRYFNVYGPRMDVHGVYTEVLVRWMERIADGVPPLILGDGKQTMDFVYVDDIARANVLAAQADVSDEVFNVASGVETSLQELAYALLAVMGSDLEPEYGPERKVNPVARRLADTRKAREQIGFEARVGLEEGLSRLVEWWRAERDEIGERFRMIPVMKPFLGEEESAAAAEVIASGWVAQGPRVAEFERVVAARVDAAHGVAVSSCTAGLHLALVALGVGPGDEVVVPSLSFIATANVVHYVGATPVFADVELSSGNLTPETIAPALTAATRAVILVHQGGVPADVAGVHALCDPRGVAVVEDAACAIGAEIDGAPVGGHSDLVVFSFHPRKVITTGEGGMVMARDAEVAARLARLREHGMSVSAAARHASSTPVIEQYLEVGFNYRMTDIQAAVGLVQLARLDEIVARRRARAARYRELLADVPGIRLVDDPSFGRSTYQSCWAMLDESFRRDRDTLLADLVADGISARRGIMASHLEPAYAHMPRGPLPNTELLTRNSVILPLYHVMTDEEQDHVVASLAGIAGSAAVSSSNALRP